MQIFRVFLTNIYFSPGILKCRNFWPFLNHKFSPLIIYSSNCKTILYNLCEEQLAYDESSCPTEVWSVGWSVCMSVDRSVIISLKGREVILLSLLSENFFHIQ